MDYTRFIENIKININNAHNLLISLSESNNVNNKNELLVKLKLF
jgi:hypothetical protein